MSNIRLAIVSPAFNEQLAIADWIRSVDRFFVNSGLQSLHLIVVDDGSADKTFAICKELKSQLKNIQLHPLRLARNFGHQAALTCGLEFAASDLGNQVDAVVTMDADGEHPLEVIPAMLEAWKAGSLIVHTKRRKHKDLSLLKQLPSQIFYRTIQVLAKLPIEDGMADFKLWDIQLLKEVAEHLRNCGSIRLFSVFLAPKGAKIEFDQRVIAGRVSRFSLSKMASLAVQSLVYYSAVPMRLIGILGFLSLAFGLIVSGYSVWAYFYGHVVQGWTSIMVALAFFSGLNTLCLFMVAEYLLRFSFRSKLPLFVRLRD